MKSVPSCAVDDASAKSMTACLISSLAWISVRIAVLKASDVKRSLIAVLFGIASCGVLSVYQTGLDVAFYCS